MLVCACVLVKARPTRLFFEGWRSWGWGGGSGKKASMKDLRLELVLVYYLDDKLVLMTKLDQVAG